IQRHGLPAVCGHFRQVPRQACLEVVPYIEVGIAASQGGGCVSRAEVERVGPGIRGQRLKSMPHRTLELCLKCVVAGSDAAWIRIHIAEVWVRRRHVESLLLL